MSVARIDGALQAATILIIDADSFRRGYFMGVLQAAGAQVVGAFASGAEALDSLNSTGSAPELAYVAPIGEDGDHIVEHLVEREVHCVAILSEDRESSRSKCVRCVLRPPLAAYQIVDALFDLRQTKKKAGELVIGNYPID